MVVVKNMRILKYLLMIVVSLLLVLSFSIGVSASSGYDRQELDPHAVSFHFGSGVLDVGAGWKWHGWSMHDMGNRI